MIQFSLPERELFDESTNRFIKIEARILRLEHSLISLSKWEMKWEKPFLTEEEKTDEEIIDYLKCMTIDSNVPDIIYETLPDDVLTKINEYMDKPMTATWFNENQNGSHKKEIITSELIYCIMIQLGIPFECQKWHLNRLFTLIRVCSIKSSPPKKMSKREILDSNRRINEARRAKMNSKG